MRKKIPMNEKGVKSLILFMLLFIGLYTAWNLEHTLTTSLSPEKNYKLAIKYVTPFSFGEHKIKLLYGSPALFSLNKKSFTTHLDNDGMALNDSNYEIEWVDDNIVKIRLIGFNLTNSETYIINCSTDEITKLLG